jgi:hypothetical protein
MIPVAGVAHLVVSYRDHENPADGPLLSLAAGSNWNVF